MPRPLVSIVIATLNTPRMTETCLNTVVKNTSVPYELIVINNSCARSIQECLAKFKDIRIIQNPRNLGYTKAANQGVRVSRGKYLCFLNTDTCVPPRWMERLLEAFRNPGVGAAGPMSQDSGVQYTWSTSRPEDLEILTLLTDEASQRLYSNSSEIVPRLWGFCWVIPRSVMAQVGLFDERFFFGWEDIDYCLRLRFHGFQLVRRKSLFVHHQRSGSATVQQRSRLVLQTERSFSKKWCSILNLPPSDYRTIFRVADHLSNSPETAGFLA